MSGIHERAVEAAWAFGHGRLLTEHLLFVVLSGDSASAEALRASGITAEEFARETEALSERYTGEVGVPGKRRPVTYDTWAGRVLARAEGLAGGFGSSAVADDHLLLALLWEPVPSVAEELLERRGITRERILEHLELQGVRLPSLPAPKRFSWGPWTPVAPDEALAVGKELRRAGMLYRIARRDDETFISSAPLDPAAG